mmetsp:Transcript_6474/g.27254  ORF Transcript_6474/g.27254 Transcript_6474/m.27254 type:complete len:391 (-) Transcript_6474:148-1320(-)
MPYRLSAALLVLAAGLARAEDGWPLVVVATFEGCRNTNVSSTAQADLIYGSVAAAAGTAGDKAAAGCGTFCGNTDFFADRCASPRATCVVKPVRASYGLVLSNPVQPSYPAPGAQLEAGTYVVILGAQGTYVTSPYDEQLAAAGYTVLNLARSGGSLRAILQDWPAIESVVVNAFAVVVTVMSLRASENAACPYGSCSVTERTAIWRAATSAAKTTQELESLATAVSEYETLLTSIATSPRRVGSAPQTFLLWHAVCDPARGCKRAWDHPQWFTDAARVAAVASLGWTAFVDANYATPGDPQQFETVPLDKCDHFDFATYFAGCKRRDAAVTAVCDAATHRAAAADDACTTACAAVDQHFFPIQPGHDHAYAALAPLLASAQLAYGVTVP